MSKLDLSTCIFFWLVPIIVLFQLSSPAPLMAEITVSAVLSNARIAAGEQVQLAITVNGARTAELQLPEVTGFELYRSGQSSRVNIINSKISESITTTCVLVAHAPGSFTIPPIIVKAGSTTLRTKPIPFEVITTQAPGGTAVSPEKTDPSVNSHNSAYIIIEEIERELYIGQVVPLVIKAFFRQGPRTSLDSYPSLKGNGLVMPQLNEEPSQYMVSIDGTRYHVLTWQTALTAIKEGKQRLQLGLDATMLVPDKRPSSRMFGMQSPFDDDLFDSFFGSHKRKRLKIVSDEITLNILPLPEAGKPPSFTGAVGDFSLYASVEPESAEVGEPLTLSVSIRGQGNFDRVEQPEFPESSDWKTYSPTTHFTPQSDAGYTGEKIFEQAIVPNSGNIKEVPALRFSYFQPRTKNYVTAESSPIPITIAEAQATTVQPPAPETPPSPPARQTAMNAAESAPFASLAPLQLDPGKFVTTSKPLFQRPWYLLLILCCLTVLSVVTINNYRKRRGLNRSSEYERERQLQAHLTGSLKAMQTAMQEDNSSSFLAICRSAIQQYYGRIWQIDPATITRADLLEKATDQPLIEIFTAAEEAAYGGNLLDRQTMESFSNILQSELEKSQ